MRLSGHQRVIDAAISTAREDGLLGMTINAVAAEAGLSKGGVFYHFPSKDALLDAVFDDVWRKPDEAALSHLGKARDTASREQLLEAAIRSSGDGAPIAGPLAVQLEVVRDAASKQRARDFSARWLEPDGVEPTVSQQAALLAAGGLWLQDVAGLGVLTPAERRSLIDHLVAMMQASR